MKRVLVTEPIHEAGMALLHGRDDIEVVVPRDTGNAAIAEAMAGIHGIAVRTVKLPAEILSLSDDLQVVSRHGVGCDNVAVDYLTARGIPVAIAAGANATSVAEHTMGLILATARHMLVQDAAVRAGDFNARFQRIATDLHGASLLIVGFGRAGRKVAPLARAFGMAVTVADIVLDCDLANDLGCRAVEDFRPELPGADFVTLHVPLDDTTRHLVSTAELERMKPGAVLINCARGGIVDETAMVAALDAGLLAAAGLDVFDDEPPPPDSPLLSRADVVLTPHAGAASHGAMRAMAEMAAQNILDSFDGKLAPDCTFNLDGLAPS